MDIALSAQTNPGRLQSASLKVNRLRVQSKSIIVAAEVWAVWVRKVEKVEDGRRISEGVIKSLYRRHLPLTPPFLLPSPIYLPLSPLHSYYCRLTPHSSTSPLVPLHPPYYGHNVKGTPDEIEFANGKREWVKRICFLSLTPLRSPALLARPRWLSCSRRSCSCSSPRRSTTYIFRRPLSSLPLPLYLPMPDRCDYPSVPGLRISSLYHFLLRTSRHICPTLRKWLTVEIPRSWCVLARSGNWCDVRFFWSISFEEAIPPRQTLNY